MTPLRVLHLVGLRVGGAHNPLRSLAAALGDGGVLAERRPQLIVLGGDNLDVSDPDAASALIDGLDRCLAACALERSRVVAVPGPLDARPDRWWAPPPPEAYDAYFADADAMDERRLRFKSFFEVSDALGQVRAFHAQPPLLTQKRVIDGWHVGVLGLNTGWLCPGAQGPVVLGGDALVGHAVEAAPRASLLLLVARHGPDQLDAADGARWAERLAPAAHLALTGGPPEAAGGWLVEIDRSRAVRQRLEMGVRCAWHLAGDPETVELRAPLDSASTPAPGPLGAGDLEALCAATRKACARVNLKGLSRTRASAELSDVYVPLRTLRAGLSAPPDGLDVEPGQRALSDDEPARLEPALRALGLPAEIAGSPEVQRAALDRLKQLHPERWRPLTAPVLRRALTTVELDRAVAEKDRVYLEGDPGTGKTTTLHHLAMVLVRAHAGEPDDAERLGFSEPFPVPVFVPLADLWKKLGSDLPEGGHAPLLQFLQDRAGFALPDPERLEPALRDGRIILLLDGLDEVPSVEGRRRAALILRDFVAAFPQSRYVLSTRPSGLDNEVREAFDEAGMNHLRVDLLDRDQIERFVGRWYEVIETCEEAARDGAGELLRLLETPDRLDDRRELQSTPVTLLAITKVHAVRGRLPEQKAELYRQCVETLCTLRKGWGLDLKVIVLRRLALRIHEQGRDGRTLPDVAARRATFDVLPEERRGAGPECVDPMLEALADQTGLLIRSPEDDGWQFRHLTFQEYLAGRALVDEETSDARKDALAERMVDTWWRESVRLALGYLCNQPAEAGEVLSHLVERVLSKLHGEEKTRALHTLADGMCDLRGYDQRPTELTDCAGRLQPAWAEGAEDPDVEQRARLGMGEALGAFGDPRLGFTADHCVYVPGGPFVMGDPEFGDERESVEVPELRIARYPVTCGQFLEFVDATGREVEERHRSYWSRRLNHPVVYVSRPDAEDFCRWLNQAHPCPDGWHWRLPTEKEWEKAARGGAVIDGGPNPAPERSWPWEEETFIEDAANYDEKLRGTSPVGCFPAGRGPYGALDQAGNVWEWVYPEGGGTRARRALRGGGWGSVPHRLRVSSRGVDEPARRVFVIGFRCVASPRPLSP